MKIGVLGAGAWGTALARLLAENTHAVTLWGHCPEHLAELAETGKNERYLPGIELPRSVRLEPAIAAAIRGSDCVVVATPSKAFREVTAHLGNCAGLVVSVTKGIEYNTGLTMSGVLRQTAPRARIVALSGPTFALEVGRGVPTAIVAGSEDSEAARSWLEAELQIRVATLGSPRGEPGEYSAGLSGYLESLKES